MNIKNKNLISFYRYARIVGTTASVFLVLFAIGALFPHYSSDNSAKAIDNPSPERSNLEMTVKQSSAALKLETNKNNNGTFASTSDDDLASFDVITNNYTGYTLSVFLSDDSGKLVGESASFSSINAPISAATFDAPAYNGKWGYIPSKINSAENTSFLPAPTLAGSVLDRTTGANTVANN